jgi:sialate O-acetylesterase
MIPIKMKKTSLFSVALLISIWSLADVRLPKIFADNMVLQRNQPIPVWGWADAGEKITVQFDKQVKTIKTDKSGKWLLKLDAELAGGPFDMTIIGKNKLICKNILVGEVWICSGQSNMEMPIEGWGKINNYQQEIAAADYDQIRHFKVQNAVDALPQTDIKGGDWKICSPQTAGDFSAVGYFFARALYQQLHVPIGLINTSWGGTMIETWISRDAFEQSDEFKSMIEGMKALNLDSLAQVRKQAVLAKVTALQGPLVQEQVADTWNKIDIDDHDWKTMKVPGVWEDQGLGLEDLDGTVWFRKTVMITKENADKEASLELGMIDDRDVSFINGIKVGATNGYAVSRKYTIPAGILKEGRNLIAVQVTDYGGSGGFYSDSNLVKLRIGTAEIPLAGSWAFHVAKIITGSVSPNNYPTLLFNAMINPLIPFGIKGALWYQGEANAQRAFQYRKAFPLLISNWRSHWGQGDFPFYFVQLASFNAADSNSTGGSDWAELREAQSLTLSLPATGMAVTTDIGNVTDIHPKNKQEVGKRLASIALNQLYGIKMEYSGPMYQSMKIAGDSIILSFTHVGKGLTVIDKYGYLRGFEIAGADQQFHFAKSMVQDDRVVVFQQGLHNPVAVRYGWVDFAGDANLFNQEGYPAVPFRTDQWKELTEAEKYSIGK